HFRISVHALAEFTPARAVARAQCTDRARGRVDVARQLQAPASGQRGDRPRIGLRRDERLCIEAEIADDARRNPARLPPIRARCAVDDGDCAACAREVMRRYELVRARSDDDGSRLQLAPPSTAEAALRPEAPMTPPPGCVPDPHW